MKVILAIDDSKFSETATGFLANYFRPEQTEVMILHASDSLSETDWSHNWASKLEWEATHKAEALVSHAADKLVKAGFEVTMRTEGGDARAKIVEAAGAWPADLIILGSHGRTGLDRLLLGSVSENVARSAPCSVGVIRMNTAPSGDAADRSEELSAKKPLKVLLAIDDSPEFSESAVQAIDRHLFPARTEICVLHVVESIYSRVASYSYVVHPRDVEAVQQELTKRGEELVERAGRILTKSGFKVSTAVEAGDARIKIVDYAWQWMADLIVVSSHGNSGLNRLLIGSVSESVARHSHCSVEIVRPAAAPEGSLVAVASPEACVETS